jgi:hypothetical protein
MRKTITLSVFLLALSFYLYTMLPSLAWGDGVKLQSEAIAGESFVLAEMSPGEFTPDPFPFSRVGVAAWDHPLYIVLGHLLVRALPFADPLWLINFLSAFFGASSVALVFLLGMRFTASIFASLYASLSLAVAHTFWWHSSTPEVYTLFVFLFLLSFYFFDRFERTGKPNSLVTSAFFLGLAACTHVLAFLAVPALGLYYLFSGAYRNFQRSDFKKLVLPAIGFLAGFSLYIVQFVRMSLNFPLSEIMGPVVGSTFLSQLGTYSPLVLGGSVLSYLFFLTVQFGPIGLALGSLGIRRVFKSKDPLFLKIFFAFVVFALFGILYRVTDQFTFFIASYVFWALLMGLGADFALGLLPLKWRFPIPVMLGVLLFATPFFYTSLPRLAKEIGLNDASIGIPAIGVGLRDGLAYYINPNKRGDFDAYDFGYQTVSNLAPGALVVAEWYTDTDEYFILRYLTRITKLRPDVTVAGWPTQDPFSFDSGLVLALIDDSFPERPVYLASLSEKFYAASELVETYCVIPENNLYRLYLKDDGHFQCLGVEAVTE